MYHMYRLCQLCLCKDRKMFLMKELKIMLLELNLWETKYIDGYVCWECEGAMQKFCKFKSKIRKAQHMLSHAETTDLKDLSSLSINVAVQLTIDPELNTLSECDEMSIKSRFGTTSNNKVESLKQEPLNGDKSSTSANVIEVTIDPLEAKNNCNINSSIKQEFIDSDMVTVKLETDSADEQTACASKPTSDKKSYTPSIENFLQVDEITIGEQTDNVDDKIIAIEITGEELNQKRQQIKDDPNFKNCVHKCETCLIGFNMYKSYQVHMSKSHYNTPTHLVCRICEVQFLKAKQLAAHQKQHYINYKCKDCGSEFRDKTNALFHYRIRHKDQSPHQRRRQFIEVKMVKKQFQEVAKKTKKELDKKRAEKRKCITEPAEKLHETDSIKDLIKKEKDQMTLTSNMSPIEVIGHRKKIKLETEVEQE